MSKLTSPQALGEFSKTLNNQFQKEKPCIVVCGGTGCHAAHTQKVIDAFQEKLAGLSDKISMRISGCLGLCEKGPLVMVFPQEILYQKVKPDDVDEIINETALAGKSIERLCFKDNGSVKPFEKDIQFIKGQYRLLLGQHRHIDSGSIDDYIRVGGYSAVVKALTQMKPEEIIEEVTVSGLKGRGGGGFLTGRKWKSCRNAPGEKHYIICNADEGDPGAFCDCSIMEANAHSVIEGMIIGAFAIGGHDGYIYIRREYPLAMKRVRKAVEQAREYGLLGRNILGTGFDFDITITSGGGAFVCGESTALMASLEGKVGEPRAKHIHTVESGLNGLPSNLNNVETWANVPLIINKGGDWFKSIGVPHSTGTKIFSLTGKVVNTGLIEVPMGRTLRQIIFDVGGGIRNGKKFKAVQTGGPSGGCLPESLLDLSVDFDTLWEHGSMMGSGGMIIMDEETCMVDVAKYFLEFLREESCGKCTPCREGIKQLVHILERITEGKGQMEDLDILEELSDTIKETSICQLGGSAPNPLLSTLKYFRSEYEAHIKDRKCPAKVCKDLITFSVIADKCTGCMRCSKICPTGAAVGEKKQVHTILQDKCIKCRMCYQVCPDDAILIE